MFFENACIARKSYINAKGQTNGSINKITAADLNLYLAVMDAEAAKITKSVTGTSNKSWSRMQHCWHCYKNNKRKSKNSWNRVKISLKPWIKTSQHQNHQEAQQNQHEKQKNGGANTAKRWHTTAATIVFLWRQMKIKGLSGESKKQMQTNW